MTNRHPGVLDRLRGWLAIKLLGTGVQVEIEARHGPFRARLKQVWSGGLIRVDIPVQRLKGVTSTPLGDVAEPQKFINSFTGKDGDQPFASRELGGRWRTCPFCGYTKACE